MELTPEVTAISWKPCWRIIPSRFPPIQLFERITDPSDLEAIFELDSITNPRLHEEVGNLDLVVVEERVSGPGTSVIMAAFTHLNPSGGRFSGRHNSVFYGAKTLSTAISESRYHRERFMQNTGQPATQLDMRVYSIDLTGKLHDLRGKKDELPLIYDKDDYAASQQLASTLRKSKSNGLVYDSVREQNGECAAVFRPSLLSNARQERHLCYVWDGNQITDVYEKREFSGQV